MRIGITCYPTYGGSGDVATELGIDLARRGHEVHFVSYASPFRLRGFAPRVTFHEVVTTDYPLFEHSPYALALAVKQHEVAQREKLEIMHVHYAIPHAATAWLAKQMLRPERDLKVVTTLHGTDITLVVQDPSYYTLTKFSIEQSDAVTAVSRYLRDETYRAFGCVDCDVRVISNFISPAEYHPPRDGSCRGALSPADYKILTHVSNFRPVKRVVDVVRVFASVCKAMPATLVLIGDGPERDAAEHEADRLGLGEDVRFLGKVDGVRGPRHRFSGGRPPRSDRAGGDGVSGTGRRGRRDGRRGRGDPFGPGAPRADAQRGGAAGARFLRRAHRAAVRSPVPGRTEWVMSRAWSVPRSCWSPRSACWRGAGSPSGGW